MTNDGETTCTILDPHTHESVAVRVWFVHDLPFSEHLVTGVFRLGDDSEIDFNGLLPNEQDKINRACETQLK